jgi:TRAP-type C4-dicarboxylate transport system substrate-binding protein
MENKVKKSGVLFLIVTLSLLLVILVGCAGTATTAAPSTTAAPPKTTVTAAPTTAAPTTVAPTTAVPTSAAPAKQLVFSMAGTVPDTDIKSRAIRQFADEVLAKTNGAVKINVFTNGQLIADKDMGTAMPAGMADFAQAQIGIFTNVPDAAVLDMVFTYTNDDHWWAVANGPLRDSIAKQLSTKSNCTLLAWIAQGPTDVWASTNKVIKTPADLKGVKFRTPPSTFYVKAVTALGAAGTIISVNELYTALQTGTVTATFCNARIYNENKWFEVAPYLTKMNSAPQSNFAIIANNDSWKKIPAEYQQIIATAAKNQENWTRATKETEGYWDKIIEMQKAGKYIKDLYIATPADIQPFIDIVMPTQVAAIKALPNISPGVIDLLEQARPKAK